MVKPNIEYDQLVWGNVNSRLQNDNYYNINNTQHDGYGIRGELMFGRNAGQPAFGMRSEAFELIDKGLRARGSLGRTAS